MEIVELAIALIDEDKDQPRYQFDDEALQELMKSIGELGLLSPIKVRATGDGRYKIIYGNRRYKACQMLGRTTIPCIVSTASDEMEIYLEQIAENLTREGFSPIEEAEAFDKLLNDSRFTSSVKFLASKLGKPESYIKNKLELLKFGPAVRKLIVSGTQIRKDKLTEDQLLPLRDLALEHRDPLALIVARDEMPVTDVKKIAKLFKDPDIPSGVKDKLLFKDGPGLIETWSTYELNKKERAKAAAEKERKAAERLEQERLAQAQQAAEERPDGNGTAHGTHGTGQPLAPADAMEAPSREADHREQTAPQPTPLEIELRKLQAALPETAPDPETISRSLNALLPVDREALIREADGIIHRLEQQLSAWRSLREPDIE